MPGILSLLPQALVPKKCLGFLPPILGRASSTPFSPPQGDFLSHSVRLPDLTAADASSLITKRGMAVPHVRTEVPNIWKAEPQRRETSGALIAGAASGLVLLEVDVGCEGSVMGCSMPLSWHLAV